MPRVVIRCENHSLGGKQVIEIHGPGNGLSYYVASPDGKAVSLTAEEWERIGRLVSALSDLDENDA